MMGMSTGVARTFGFAGVKSPASGYNYVNLVRERSQCEKLQATNTSQRGSVESWLTQEFPNVETSSTLKTKGMG